MQRTASGTSCGLCKARWLRALLVVGAPSLLSACPDDPPAVDPPQPTTIEIIPPIVAVVPNVAFTMRALVRDQHGMMLPDSYAASVAWTLPPGAALKVDPAGASTTGASIGILATTSGPTSLQASLSGITEPATARITVATASEVGALDWIIAPHKRGQSPAVALVDGHSSLWNNDRVFTFVGNSALDIFLHSESPYEPGNWGRLSLFPYGWSVAYTAVTWKAMCDVADFTSGPNVDATQMFGATASAVTGCSTPTVPSLALPTTLAAAVRKAAWRNIDGIVSADVRRAKDALAQVPTGLVFEPNISPALGYTGVDVYATADGSCLLDGDLGVVTQLVNRGQLSNTEFQPNKMTIVYVDHVTIKLATSGGAAVDAPVPGIACPSHINFGTIVLISVQDRHDTTLAHEVGHALGPWPNWGHAEDSGIPNEFDAGNLMWGGEVDDAAANRRHLTLGQIFRITLAQKSFVQGQVNGIVCDADMMKDVPCPRLSTDVRQ